MYLRVCADNARLGDCSYGFEETLGVKEFA